MWFSSMLLGLGYGCRIRVCVRHGYGSIFVSFSIYLKDRSVIPMSGSERHTHVRHGYIRENEESEQHRLRQPSFGIVICQHFLLLFFVKLLQLGKTPVLSSIVCLSLAISQYLFVSNHACFMHIYKYKLSYTDLTILAASNVSMLLNQRFRFKMNFPVKLKLER